MTVLYTYQHVPCPYWLLIVLGIVAFAVGFVIGVVAFNPLVERGWLGGVIVGVIFASIVVVVLTVTGLTIPRTRKKVLKEDPYKYEEELEGYKEIGTEGLIIEIEEIVETPGLFDDMGELESAPGLPEKSE